MTASTSWRSWSACHSSTASPTRAAACNASMSSHDPGKRTIPNLIGLTPRSRSPRSAGSSATARTSRADARDPRRPARSGARRGRCSRRRSRAPAAPARPPGPAGRGSPPWAGRGPEPSSGSGEPGVERLARDALVRLDVLLAGARDHVFRDRGRRWVPIPAGRRGPVAHELLVEARLCAAGLVFVRGPEAGGIGGADLVAERQLAVGVEPELELGVGKNDPALAGVLGGVLVDGDRDLADALGQRAVADQLGGALEVDVLVVALGGLSRRGEDRFGQPVGFAETGRHRDPAHLAGPLVVLPPRAAQVATDH